MGGGGGGGCEFVTTSDMGEPCRGGGDGGGGGAAIVGHFAANTRLKYPATSPQNVGHKWKFGPEINFVEDVKDKIHYYSFHILQKKTFNRIDRLSNVLNI